jgi:8-oxo-dGTP pyrophosphatase MutT (NUDIX family)
MNEYYVLEYPTFINVIAITKDGHMVLVRQYRHGLGRTCFELVAGCVEEGEDPMDAAKRELLEETGYAGGTWTEWMTLSPNPATCTNLAHSFLATGVQKVSGQHLDPTEDIEVRLESPEFVRDLLMDNQILQALMAAPLWKYFYGKIL